MSHQFVFNLSAYLSPEQKSEMIKACQIRPLWDAHAELVKCLEKFVAPMMKNVMGDEYDDQIIHVMASSVMEREVGPEAIQKACNTASEALKAGEKVIDELMKVYGGDPQRN